MYSCDEISHLKLFENEANFGVRLKMKMHVWICKACQAYCSQIEMIDDSYKKSMGKMDQEIDSKRLDEIQEKVISENSES